MSYENSAACLALATFCACCSRPLVDATSVELGIGPICRKDHGFDKAEKDPDWILALVLLDRLMDAGFAASDKCQKGLKDNDARVICNALVHYIAVMQDGGQVVKVTEVVAALGYTKLAGIIGKRLGQIIVTTNDDGTYTVIAPYSDEFNRLARSVPGTRGEKIKRQYVRIVPQSSRKELFMALKGAFPGTLCVGSKGAAML